MKKITKYFRREIEEKVEKWLDHGYIVAIVGARQVGKTTLLKKIEEEEKNPCFYYLLDDPLLRQKINSDFYFLQKDIEARLGVSLEKFTGKICLLIDEAQKAPSIFEYLKILVDTHKEKVKIVISGSSSLEIQKKGAESLAGRLQYAYLFPLSIGEILRNEVVGFSGSFFESLLAGQLEINKLKKLQAPLYPHQRELTSLLERALTEGMLPFIWQKRQKIAKKEYLRSVVNTYLEKDIRAAGLVREFEAYFTFLETLAFQIGGMLNLSKLSQATQVSVNTLKNHRSILENTFVINKLPPFVRKPVAKLVKSAKVYFYDVGVANFLAGRESYKNVFDSKASGGIFENVILKSFEYFASNEPRLIRTYFFRDYQGREIDLVITSGEEIIPVEITNSSSVPPRKLANFEYFFSCYPSCQQGLVVYNGELDKLKISNRPVFFLPWWLWW